MQAHRIRSGHFISAVDARSPAEAAGLQDGDRIVEVNDENVEQASHAEVVDKIKAITDQVRLLVVDPAADMYFSKNNIVIVGSMDCVQEIACPESKPGDLIGQSPSATV